MTENQSDRVQSVDKVDQLPTMEEIEDAIPEDRKKLSFGGPDEGIIDVMDRMEEEAHWKGRHMDEELETCPACPDPDNERVSPDITGAE